MPARQGGHNASCMQQKTPLCSANGKVSLLVPEGMPERLAQACRTGGLLQRTLMDLILPVVAPCLQDGRL